MDLPTYEDVLAARERIAGRIVRTPMLRNALLDELHRRHRAGEA